MNPPEFEDLASQLDEQVSRVVTLREVLRWFNLPALTVTGNWRIQESMESLGILCSPALAQANLDTSLEFRRRDGTRVEPRTPGTTVPRETARENTPVSRGLRGVPEPPQPPGERGVKPGNAARRGLAGNATPREAREQFPVDPPDEIPRAAAPALEHIPQTSAREAMVTEGEPQTGDGILRLRHLEELRPERFLSVGPDESLMRVESLLLLHGVSMVAVMKNSRTPCGILGWRQLGEAKLRSVLPRRAIECTEKVFLDCSIDTPVSNVLPRMGEYEAVLVREKDQQVVALLTRDEVKSALVQIGTPSLLLREIESHLRHLIVQQLPGELEAIQRDPAGPTFWDYATILERPEFWARLGLKPDRAMVVKELHAVRLIRNRHAHPSARPLTHDDVAKLKKFHEFLRKMAPP